MVQGDRKALSLSVHGCESGLLPEKLHSQPKLPYSEGNVAFPGETGRSMLRDVDCGRDTLWVNWARLLEFYCNAKLLHETWKLTPRKTWRLTLHETWRRTLLKGEAQIVHETWRLETVRGTWRLVLQETRRLTVQ